MYYNFNYSTTHDDCRILYKGMVYCALESPVMCMGDVGDVFTEQIDFCRDRKLKMNNSFVALYSYSGYALMFSGNTNP